MQTNAANVLALILHAKEHKVTRLDLSNCQLVHLPDELFDLQNLETLVLSDNQIASLPKAIVRLRRLQVLDLTANPIALPASVLETLDAEAIINHYRINIGFETCGNQAAAPSTTAVNLQSAKATRFVENLPNELGASPSSAATAPSNTQSYKKHFFLWRALRMILQAARGVLISVPLISRPAESPQDLHVNPEGMSLQDKAKFWEAEYGPFPRPINEQHISSYAAWRRISMELTLTSTVAVNALVCFVVWILIGRYLNVLLHFVIGERWAAASMRMPLFWAVVWLVLGLLPILLITLVDGAFTLWKPYYVYLQRETYGTAKWQLPKQLYKSKKWLFRYQEPPSDWSNPKKTIIQSVLKLLRYLWIGNIPEDPLKHRMFPVAPFGFGTWVCFPLGQFARHLILFGIPGSGKSASFIMSYVRSAASLGSSFVMDIKGEMFRHCAHYYKRVFRIDFEEAHLSDRFLLGRMLRRDYDFARTVGQSIVKYDPDQPSGGGNDAFFRSNAAQLLTAFLLHLSETDPDFHPGDIFAFLEAHPADDKEENGLVEQLRNSANKDVREIIAGMPTRAAETFDGIVSNMTEGLQAFKDPHVIKVFTPPTKEELDKGCRIFDPFVLRQEGTACFMVITEGKAKRIGNVLGTLINIVYNSLRRTGDARDTDAYLPQHAVRMFSPKEVNAFSRNFQHQFCAARGLSPFDLFRRVTPEEYSRELGNALKNHYISTYKLEQAAAKPCFVFFIVDEAGNVSLIGLREKTGVGRAFNVAFILVYHSVAQMATQLGRDYADTVKGTVGTRIFLPGLEGDTAKYASFLLRRTTTLQSSGTDSRNDAFDSNRVSETGRDLMTEDEVRTLLEYKQAVMVSFALDPFRIAFPPEQTKLDAHITAPSAYCPPLTPPGLDQQIQDFRTRVGKIQANDANKAYSIEAEAGFVDSEINSPEDLELPEIEVAPDERKKRAPSQDNAHTNILDFLGIEVDAPKETDVRRNDDNAPDEVEMTAPNKHNKTTAAPVLSSFDETPSFTDQIYNLKR